MAVIDLTLRNQLKTMPIHKRLAAAYPQHSPRCRPPARARLVTSDLHAFGPLAGWARSAGCALDWSDATPDVFDTRPLPGPQWWAIDLGGWPDPLDLPVRLAQFRRKHAEIQILLVMASRCAHDLGHDLTPLCDAVLTQPLDYDRIEEAIDVMQRNAQARLDTAPDDPGRPVPQTAPQATRPVPIPARF